MIYEFNIDTILARFFYVEGNKNMKKLEKKLNWQPKGIPGLAIAVQGTTDKEAIFIIAMKKNHSKIGNIVHEANHIVEYMFAHFGFTDRHEHKSYLLGHIIEVILEAKKRKRN